MTASVSAFAAALAEIAHDAGQLILRFYAEGARVRTKADDSPVTEADEEAERLIAAGLAQLAPDVPVIAEEAMAKGHKPAPGPRFFLVDPLDGTKEFLKRNGEFTVNIALIEDGRPVIGVLLAPAKHRLFIGDGSNGAFEVAAQEQKLIDLARARTLHVRSAPKDGLIALASRTHGDLKTEEYLSRYPIAKLMVAGSSLKFGLIAAGEADLYPRHGPTMEWDTAAGQAVLEAAGGSVTTLEGAPLKYGKIDTGYRNPYFVARGRV